MRVMNRNLCALLITSVFFVVVAVALGPAAPNLWANSSGAGAKIPFSDARILIELNATDEDVGIQVFLDAEGWKKVSIVSPDGRTILEVLSSGKLRKQGLTELFFESEEPSLDDVPLSEFLARFPGGGPQVVGTR